MYIEWDVCIVQIVPSPNELPTAGSLVTSNLIQFQQMVYLRQGLNIYLNTYVTNYFN